jgi:hypothetical protein
MENGSFISVVMGSSLSLNPYQNFSRELMRVVDLRILEIFCDRWIHVTLKFAIDSLWE